MIVVLVGCGQDRQSDVESTRETAALTGGVTDPCTVALTQHVGTDRLDQSIVKLQDEIRRAVDPSPLLERLGWAFVTKARRSFDPGFYKLAEQTALCMGEQQNELLGSLLLQGHVLHNMHRFRDAEGVARQLVRKRGLSFDYGLLGDVLMEQGKLSEAVSAYQQMMDQKPSPQAYIRAAHVRWLRGDLAGATELMRIAAPGFRDRESAAWAQVRLAGYEWQAGNDLNVTEHIHRALTLRTDYPPALLMRGRLLLAEGRYQDAIVTLRRAVQFNPLPEYQWVLSEALHLAGHSEKAREVDLELKQHGEVNDRRTFALYLATTDQNVETAVRLAQDELIARADVFTLDTLAWALFAAGKPEAAHAYSLRAVAEGTQDARLFYHAGVIAAAVGQHDEASHWLVRATLMQHMLLPSEREQLAKAFTTLPTQVSALMAY